MSCKIILLRNFPYKINANLKLFTELFSLSAFFLFRVKVSHWLVLYFYKILFSLQKFMKESWREFLKISLLLVT